MQLPDAVLRAEPLRHGQHHVTPTCEWVKADLKQGPNGGTNGACAKLGKSDLCKLVNAACAQAAITRLWIEGEFNNTIIATPELIKPVALTTTANKTLESGIQIGKIIAAGPQKTIDRWASANMPKVLEVIGGLTDRVRVLSLKQNRDDVEHEATTSKVDDDQLFYCRSRGMDEEEAVALVVNGFCKEVLQALPMEFAMEAQQLVAISLEGSVG